MPFPCKMLSKTQLRYQPKTWATRTTRLSFRLARICEGNLYDVPHAETHAEITPPPTTTTDADIDLWVLDHGVDVLAAFDELW